MAGAFFIERDIVSMTYKYNTKIYSSNTTVHKVSYSTIIDAYTISHTTSYAHTCVKFAVVVCYFICSLYCYTLILIEMPVAGLFLSRRNFSLRVLIRY